MQGTIFSACPEANENATESDHTNQTNVCNTAVSNTNPGPLRANYNRSWSYDMFDMAVAQPRRYLSGNSSFLYGRDVGLGHVWDFSTLGTHVVEVMVGAKPHQSTDPWKNAVGRYTFHVGPAADLGVDFGGSVAMPGGKRAFTVIATSDATADVRPAPLHEGNKGAWKSLRPLLKITDGNGKVPANVTQHYARWDAPPAHAGSYDGLGSYDTTTGVWTLPEGFHGVAYLTLVADAPTGGVKASIDNPEWCENDDGSAAATATGRTDCEGHVTAPISGKHWGSYQVCVNTSRVTVALAASSKTACTTQNSNNTWHTAEVLDWNDSNDSGEWALGDGFDLSARGAGRTSVDLRWDRQAGADDYEIYSATCYGKSKDDCEAHFGGFFLVGRVPGDVTEYYYDRLGMGETRNYIIRARKDGQFYAMSNPALATAAIDAVGAQHTPGTVNGLTARRQSDETRIEVTWSAPGGRVRPVGYDVEYRSSSGGGWSRAATEQVGRSYTLSPAGGGTTFRFRVRAVNVVDGDSYPGNWRESGDVGPVAKPYNVGSLTATRNTTDEAKITVTWTAPSNATAVTTYDVEYQQDGGDWSGATTGLAAASYDFTGAFGGSRYVFRVRAVTPSGGDKLKGNWQNSNTVRGLAVGPVPKVEASRGTADPDTADPTSISVIWDKANRATGYEVQYRAGTGSWRNAAATTGNVTFHRQPWVDGPESYTFRVRGVSDAGKGNWTESAAVPAPSGVSYHGYLVGPTVADGKMAWITLKVTGGPWWFEYRNHAGDWSSCARVAGGSRAITNLRAPHKHIVEIFDASGCSDGDRITRAEITTVDVPDPILDRADFSRHTHKRPYPSYGELGVKPSNCAQVEQHSHGWPGGGGGMHWHCPIYNIGSSPGAPPQTSPPQGGATGQAGGAQGQSGQTAGGATGQSGQTAGGATGQSGQTAGGGQGETELTGLAAVMAAINAYFNGTGTLAEAYAALQSYYG